MLSTKLESLMKSRNINKAQLAKGSGLPYTTVDGIFKKNADNIKLSTLKKISRYFNVSIDYFDEESPLDETGDHQVNFASAEEAMIFIIKNPAMIDFGGYEISDLDDSDLIDVAKQATEYLSFIIKQRKK